MNILQLTLKLDPEQLKVKEGYNITEDEFRKSLIIKMINGASFNDLKEIFSIKTSEEGFGHVKYEISLNMFRELNRFLNHCKNIEFTENGRKVDKKEFVKGFLSKRESLEDTLG